MGRSLVVMNKGGLLGKTEAQAWKQKGTGKYHNIMEYYIPKIR